MMNQNGTVVLQAIEDLNEPVTAKNVVDYIALQAAIDPDKELRSTVRKTLEGGVRYGYLQKKGSRYYAAPLDLCRDNGNVEEESETNDDIADDADVPQYSDSRRRSSSRRRSRSRH